MGGCEYKDVCAFYKGLMRDMPGFIESDRSVFCEQDSVHCARYLATTTLGYAAVPPEILPGDLVAARRADSDAPAARDTRTLARPASGPGEGAGSVSITLGHVGPVHVSTR